MHVRKNTLRKTIERTNERTRRRPADAADREKQDLFAEGKTRRWSGWLVAGANLPFVYSLLLPNPYIGSALGRSDLGLGT